MTVVAPGIDGPLAEQPLAGEGAAAPNVTNTGTVSLAGRVYVLDPGKGFTRETLEMRKASQDQSATPGQQTLTDAGLWHRSQTDWSLGAGQAHFDREDSSPRRFLSSKGFDPWEPGELRLLHEATESVTIADGNAFALSVAGIAYWVNGANLRVTADPFTPTGVLNLGLGAHIHGITTDGANVYILFADAINRTVVGSNVVEGFSTFGGDVIGYANGRLLAAEGARVVEIDATGVAGGEDVLDYSHANPSFRWRTITSAPNAIYLGGAAGDRSLIYSVTVNPNTGGLRTPTFACALPDGELVNCMTEYGSMMIIGTTRGFRLAQITGGNALSVGPVVEMPGGVTCFEAQGEYVWFSWNNYDSTSTGLGRMSLGELTAPLVPAYASDLMAAAQGPVVGAFTLDGKRCFTVAGEGLFVERDTLVESAVLDGGEIAWSTFALKSAAAMDLRHAPLSGSVVAQTVDEQGNVMDAGVSEVASTLGPSRAFELSGVHGEAIHPIIRGYRSELSDDAGPVLRRWTLSAVVRPKRQDRYLLPIILKSTAEDPGRVPHPYDTAEEMRFLKSIEASGDVVLQQIGADVKRVQINRIIQGGEGLRANWNDDYTGFEGVVLVETITQEPGI